MKGKRMLFLGIILGVAATALAITIAFPIISQQPHFFMGFISCLAIVLILLTAYQNYNKASHRSFRKGDPMSHGITSSSQKFRFTLIGVIILCLLFSITLIKLDKKIEEQNQAQEQIIAQHLAVEESLRKNGLMILMGKLLDKVEEELRQSPDRSLSDDTIDRIAQLSHSFEPEGYRYFENDSLSRKAYSVERGQLLQELLLLEMDSNTFENIKRKVDFAGADLRNLNLVGKNLSHINLMCANFHRAYLQQVNFKKADLRGSSFWAANLDSSHFNESALNRVDFRWADLNGINLENAVLKGANLSNAKFKNTNLANATIRWAKLYGTFLNGANLSGSDLYGSDLRNANLNHADLTKTTLWEVQLAGANLSETLLDSATVQTEDWLSKIRDWMIEGSEYITQSYEISISDSKNSSYMLNRKKD